MNKKILGVVGGIFLFGGVLYAADTIIVNIAGGQTSDNPGSSGEYTRTIGDGDMKLINKNNDQNILGDYFSGYYYDPAFGFFETDAAGGGNNVQISSFSYSGCLSDYTGYELIGYSYNPDFGFVNFNQDASNFVYICIPDNPNDDTTNAYIGGYAYSAYIGFQNFDGITLDTSVDRDDNHDSDGRYLKVDGIASSSQYNSIDTEFEDEVRVLGKVTKATLRKNVQQKVYTVIGSVAPANGSFTISGLGASTWSSGGDGKILQSGEVLYFGDMSGENVIISGNNNISGNKTLVVEGGNIYITGNIRGTGILGLISLSKDNNGGNIYVDPSVTDIHAIMYADKSLISYDGISELDGNALDQELANQLYIYGSVFSENTIGGSQTGDCPYYVESCSLAESEKYDLNQLRRYILVQPVDGDGNPIGEREPQFGGQESYMGDTSNTNTETQKPGYRKYPLIIEYNSKLQQTPPPLF